MVMVLPLLNSRLMGMVHLSSMQICIERRQWEMGLWLSMETPLSHQFLYCLLKLRTAAMGMFVSRLQFLDGMLMLPHSGQVCFSSTLVTFFFSFLFFSFPFFPKHNIGILSYFLLGSSNLMARFPKVCMPNILSFEIKVCRFIKFPENKTTSLSSFYHHYWLNYFPETSLTPMVWNWLNFPETSLTPMVWIMKTRKNTHLLEWSWFLQFFGSPKQF